MAKHVMEWSEVQMALHQAEMALAGIKYAEASEAELAAARALWEAQAAVEEVLAA